jgi:hypothetical protein
MMTRPGPQAPEGSDPLAWEDYEELRRDWEEGAREAHEQALDALDERIMAAFDHRAVRVDHGW